LSSEPEVIDLHTYFLFPVAIDRGAVMEEHPEIWRGTQPWFEQLDRWVTRHVVPEYAAVAARLGTWQRRAESAIDFHSSAYEDMMFFHPFIRKGFFDARDSDRGNEALVHRYAIPAKPDSRLFYEAEDGGGGFAKVGVAGLELLILANGIGILSIGVEAHSISYMHALWINEMMRKIYPSSGRQIETARIPNRFVLVREIGREREIHHCVELDGLSGQHPAPPLSKRDKQGQPSHTDARGRQTGTYAKRRRRSAPRSGVELHTT
jgi:hypothetical protein